KTARAGAPRGSLVDGLQLFPRLKTHGLAGRNVDFSAGARVTADARLTRAHIEYAEAAQFNTLALPQRSLHAGENRLDRQLSLGLGDTGLMYYFIDDIELYHRSALLKTGSPIPPGGTAFSAVGSKIAREGVTCRYYGTFTSVVNGAFGLLI